MSTDWRKLTRMLVIFMSAHLEPYEQTRTLCVGDLVVSIEPLEAADLERLLGNVLFIVSE